MILVLVPLCNLSGLDGSRVCRPNSFKKFKKVPFGSLIFQQGLDCGVCMERFRNQQLVVQLKCFDSHIFHKDCLKSWVLDHNQTKCPYCFQDIK